MLRFFSTASDGATTERQIYNRVFGQFRTSLKKDSVANYASIWTLFSPLLEDWMCFTMHYTFHSSVGRWRHKIRKFAAEIFLNAKNSAAELCQILRVVTIELVINSIRLMGIGHSCDNITALPSR